MRRDHRFYQIPGAFCEGPNGEADAGALLEQLPPPLVLAVRWVADLEPVTL